TRATIELTGRPEQIRGGRAIFDDLGSATAAVADAVQSGVDVAPSPGTRWHGNFHRLRSRPEPLYAAWNTVDAPEPDFH
ncbi:hypothetical protein EXE41_18905, partial [Halorubrum sp. SD690R]|uniref:hypothetical protein n=1 Tax=Halorubrum sp. SD690R TaxID=2518117 RepID=UPI0010F56453